MQSLAWLYEARGEWKNVVRTNKKRLEVATGNERFDLLLEIGDVELQKLEDRTRASKTYVAALEERPDDRKLLTKLMQLYSEEKDWSPPSRRRPPASRTSSKIRSSGRSTCTAPPRSSPADSSGRRITAGALRQFYEKAALEFDPLRSRRRSTKRSSSGKTKGEHEKVEKLLNARLEGGRKGERSRAHREDARRARRALPEVPR